MSIHKEIRASTSRSARLWAVRIGYRQDKHVRIPSATSSSKTRLPVRIVRPGTRRPRKNLDTRRTSLNAALQVLVRAGLMLLEAEATDHTATDGLRLV